MNKFDILKEILLARHSWREYDPQKINEQDINEILEAARHSPSAFGSEPWHLIVVSNNKVKQELHPLIWKQKQVLNASHLFLILTNKKNAFTKNSAFLRLRYQTRYQNSDEKFEQLQNNLINYLKKYINDPEEWAKRQAYILLENIILCAFAKGIGTSPMEAFDGADIINYLETNKYIAPNEYNVAVVLAAGYLPKNKELSIKPQSLTYEQLVTKIE
ncbi:nitroreductase family protein [Spiroplasma endosymbiont of Eupeodes luniger]|uniref:nitroreductase family protein n=1 Tax=Spiroplasma endosymbiont of Eupeodes luniger TaxID=3066300 RepID=UPI0030CE31E2